MIDHTSDLLKAYSAEPVAKFVMEHYDSTMNQTNSVCGDEVTVFLKIEGNILVDWSRDGSFELQTTAAASMLGEILPGKEINEVLSRDALVIEELGLHYSPRRKRSGVTALLATKNALHQYLNDGIIETFEDLGLD